MFTGYEARLRFSRPLPRPAPPRPACPPCNTWLRQATETHRAHQWEIGRLVDGVGDGESPAYDPRFPYRLGIRGTVWGVGLISELNFPAVTPFCIQELYTLFVSRNHLLHTLNYRASHQCKVKSVLNSYLPLFQALHSWPGLMWLTLFSFEDYCTRKAAAVDIGIVTAQLQEASKHTEEMALFNTYNDMLFDMFLWPKETIKECGKHRVGRVLSFFSSRRNWDFPNPSPAGECAPSPRLSGGGAHSLAGQGLGESQFRRGDIHCGTLYIYVLCGGKWKPFSWLVIATKWIVVLVNITHIFLPFLNREE